MEAKFEVVRGCCYRTHAGNKVELLWIDPKSGLMLFIHSEARHVFWLTASELAGTIAGPWRDPRRWTVGMYEYYDGRLVIPRADGQPILNSNDWKLIGRGVIVEGEGLDG